MTGEGHRGQISYYHRHKGDINNENGRCFSPNNVLNTDLQSAVWQFHLHFGVLHHTFFRNLATSSVIITSFISCHNHDLVICNNFPLK